MARSRNPRTGRFVRSARPVPPRDPKTGRFVRAANTPRSVPKRGGVRRPQPRDPVTGRFIPNRGARAGPRTFQEYAAALLSDAAGGFPAWVTSATNADHTIDVEARVEVFGAEDPMLEIEEGMTAAIARYGLWEPEPFLGMALMFKKDESNAGEKFEYRLPFWRGGEGVAVNVSRALSQYTYVFEAARYVRSSVEYSAQGGVYKLEHLLIRLHLGPERPPWL